MSALALFREGQLAQAIESAAADVKARPMGLKNRVFLCELLGFAGQWERADRQLDTMSQLAPETAMNVSLWRQLVKAAQAREQFYTQGRLPEFLVQPSPEVQLRLKASIAAREGDWTAVGDLLSQAEAMRLPLSGVCNGAPFDDFRDVDDPTASLFEVLTTTGKYYWVPMESVEQVVFQPPANSARNLLWRPVELSVRSGPVGGVFLPVIYHLTATVEDDALRLGRATDWRSLGGSPLLGIGQRTFLCGENEKAIMELEDITFAPR